MSYQVLARKYRPRGFAEMVGQEHVLTALTNALTNQRLHHSYIFSGTRGVGKTTVARIFAKCLNNPEGISATPDEHSEIAQAIDKGQFIDLIEVDAASRTKVEQTRELLENVAYPPSQGRFKIYLIDEAHQLSTSSFNALLKTLEEPPAFVKFLFATTEPQKLPITIVSRSLLFNLRQIPEELIKTQLKKVLDAEQIEFDKQAVSLLAKSGRGSVRDALSITDQAIAHTNGKLKGADLAVFLGMLDLSKLEQLIELLLESKTQELPSLLRELASFAPNYDNLIEQLLQLLQQAAMVQCTNQAEPPLPVVARLASELLPETIQLYYQLLLRGKAELAQLENGDMGFAMLILRLLAFTPAQGSEQMRAALTPQRQVAETPIATPQQAVNASVEDTQSDKPTEPIPKALGLQLPLPKNNDDWVMVFSQLSLVGFARQLAGYASFASCDDEGNLFLYLGERHHKMLKKDYHRQIVAAMRSCIDEPFHLRYQKVDEPPADSPLQQLKLNSDDKDLREQLLKDPEVSKLVNDFDGAITNVTTPYSPTTNLEDST